MKKLISFSLVILLSAASLFSQTDSLATEDSLKVITKNNSTEYTGTIISNDGGEVFTETKAQGKIYILKKNDINFTLGYGFPNMLATVRWTWDLVFPHLVIGETVFEGDDNYSTKTTGPFFFNMEVLTSDHFAFGLAVAHSSREMNFTIDGYDSLANHTTYDHKIDISSFNFLLRCVSHYNNYKNFDPYFSFGLGARINTTTDITNDPISIAYDFHRFPICILYTVGARYYFTDLIAVYCEAGIAKAPFQAGIVFRLNTSENNAQNFKVEKF